MATLCKPSKIYPKNMVYVPNNVLRNLKAQVGDSIDFKYDDGRIYLEKVDD